MRKNETIAAIVDLNPTANPSFLAEFSGGQLCEYLFRLTAAMPMTETVDHTFDTHATPTDAAVAFCNEKPFPKPTLSRRLEACAT